MQVPNGRDRDLVAFREVNTKLIVLRGETSTLQSITTVEAWQSVSFTPDEATIRLATIDVGVTATGVEKTASAVFEVALRWDPLQSWWRLAAWPKVHDPKVSASLAATGQELCDA
jgi:hypothetical protein